MNDAIQKKLSGFLQLLANPDIKSKQAAFNACYDDLTQVKEIMSWEKIVEIIKQETGIVFEAKTASNMYGRTRRKHELKIKKADSTTRHSQGDKTLNTGSVTNDDLVAPKKISNPGDLRTLRNRHIDLDDLKNGD